MSTHRFRHASGAASALAAIALAGICLGDANGAQAATLTNGRLLLDVRDDNGAVDTVSFDGIDFFNIELPVSDFGLQFSLDRSTFRYNSTDGVAEIGPFVVTSDGTTITATGSYEVLLMGGCCLVDIAIVREYWIVPGTDAYRTRTTLTNHSTGTVEIRFFDAFEPDQQFNPFAPPPSGTATANDVRVVGSSTAAVSTNPSVFEDPVRHFTNVLGNLQGEDGAVGYLSGLNVTSGDQLDDFFTSGGFDPDGTFEDRGEAIGVVLTLGIGESRTFEFDHALGDSVSSAEASFVAAPEPTLAVSQSVGLAALAVLARWRRRRAARSAREEIPA